MAGGISIHVYDVSRGVPAAGLRVELRGPDGKLPVDGKTAGPGTLDWIKGQGKPVYKVAAEVLADPKIVERLGDLGFVTKPMSPAEFTAFVASHVQSFQAPVKASGAKL